MSEIFSSWKYWDNINYKNAEISILKRKCLENFKEIEMYYIFNYSINFENKYNNTRQ